MALASSDAATPAPRAGPRSSPTPRVATEGEVKSFTIVAFAAPGIPVPFVAAIVDCDGTSVRGNIINTEPDPDHVHLGMRVRLATYSIGEDDEGTDAIGFGFEPADPSSNGEGADNDKGDSNGQ